MNRKTTISGFQFFCMIFLFEVGTSSLYGLASDAKQDAWISLLLGSLFGCILFYVYIKLYELYPQQTFTKVTQEILGEYAGKLVAIVYMVYFIYIAARDLRDFEELLVITIFNASSLILIGILMMFIVMYGAHKGLETFARANEFIFFLISIIILIIVGFESIAKIYQINNLRPVLENGWKPVIKASFPLATTFPFGEVIVFTMIMPHLNKTNKALKVGIPALIFSGMVLIFFTLKNIMILGVSGYERATFPLLTAISYINIANFVQRLDPLIVIIMVIGGFVKIFLFFYCAVTCSAELFKVKKSSDVVYPISLLVVISSLWMAPNVLHHFKEGLEIVPFYMHIPFQMIIPTALLIIALIQKKTKVKNEMEGAKSEP
ncbi:GerAB/ArcD/ProY family transporter [Gottfriedia solisilvae]|uniref:Spore germination protein KB n=1 Tax=Gottfriedia solisilvae TaxID=1516104 RepID=A0A8J3EUI3_9BACI|nr:endospore germination permease [Gottfriedia solisilvae]GGI11926.1 spore germination protein KB [Gottfriedia solisilvae]